MLMRSKGIVIIFNHFFFVDLPIWLKPPSFPSTVTCQLVVKVGDYGGISAMPAHTGRGYPTAGDYYNTIIQNGMRALIVTIHSTP